MVLKRNNWATNKQASPEEKKCISACELNSPGCAPKGAVGLVGTPLKAHDPLGAAIAYTKCRIRLGRNNNGKQVAENQSLEQYTSEAMRKKFEQTERRHDLRIQMFVSRTFEQTEHCCVCSECLRIRKEVAPGRFGDWDPLGLDTLRSNWTLATGPCRKGIGFVLCLSASVCESSVRRRCVNLRKA